MAVIDLKLEAWKNKLLDIGKRNRLINYKETKRSNLKIVKPDILDLWQDFVINERAIEFPFFDEESSDTNSEQLSLIDDEPIEMQSYIQTNQTIKEQHRTLRSLREKAKTAVEELGVNILYLSFGFLRWTESGISEQYLMSPLVLVPASLTIESINDPYILNIHEDEIVINPTLKYKLENDFGIILPEIDEDQDLKSYFNQIRELISKNKWDLVEDASLSLLSFLKINMYRDIDKHKDKIKAHNVIRTISGDASASSYDVDSINNFDHDKQTKPVDVFQVVDADSSQQDAIVSAKKGVSFVLQGPPGTGKSQTITNIIAESIADGKKVLFVSEKMAALEVVHRRLSMSGLEDFCLTLHSHKANKKEVLEQLRTVLEFTQNTVKLNDEAFQKLDQLQTDKEKLNAYINAIHTKVLTLEKTIYEVNGILANLNIYEDIIFSVPGINEVTSQKYNRFINLLNQFVHTLGKMIDDYKANPWNSANVQAVTNELRHDISSNLKNLMPKLEKAIELVNTIENTLGIKGFHSYVGLKNLSEVLEVSSHSPLVPVSWITSDDLTGLFKEIDEFSALKMKYLETKENLFSVYHMIENVESHLIGSEDRELLTSSQIDHVVQKWNEYIVKNQSYATWNRTGSFEKAKNLYNTLSSKLNEYRELKDDLLSTFENEILDIDYQSMFLRYKTEYTSFFKIFKKQYKLDKKEILGKYKSIVKKNDDETVVQTLIILKQMAEISDWLSENTKEYQMQFFEAYESKNTDLNTLSAMLEQYSNLELGLVSLNDLKEMTNLIESNDIKLKNHYEGLYCGLNTDWTQVTKTLEWASDFRKTIEKYGINVEFIENICRSSDKVSLCGRFLSEVNDSLQQIDREFTWVLALFDEKDVLQECTINALLGRIDKCKNGLASLEEWIDFRTAQENCVNEGLEDYINKIKEMQIETSKIIPVFKKRFYRLWLDAILPQYPEVMNFRRRNQDFIINEFSTLDKEQLDIAKARIKKKLIENLPSLSRFTNGADEISILKRELSKQRRIMPIRKLFAQIPNLLLTLKPCLMMSPLSVSIFLESESYEFDMVIFDEASQINTENAIGAISRAKQVIIAGDSKQLPPTNFFSASVSDEDFDNDEDDEMDDVYAYESILDEANLLPERTLLWHYRSRHEHLIAFSNAKIYKNKLVTFPSNVEKVKDHGVEYIYVKEGFYDRGGKKGNVIEAQKIAEMVFENFRKSPIRSLGVIAFGEVQQQAIDGAVRQLRMKNPTYEKFFKEDLVEAFFIKNLENVQGDERDTIIFSIGYAKPPQGGQMHMNFGPLSKSGGERRLNVAITRAKHNVKLVGSIMPTDIDLNRVSSDGPKLLRSYIDFAINGPSVLLSETIENSIIEHDSAFEEAVFNYLDRKGYHVGTQIGCSGYRIDLAIKHPTHSGKYVLGIECDGAAYHSARTARERDRLRQSVLEDMGWSIYRIWSTDWIKDPVTEGEKLVEAVEKALLDYNHETDNFNIESIEISDRKNTEQSYLTIDIKDVQEEENDNPYQFEIRDDANFNSLPRNSGGYLDLGDCILEVVNKEYPVHYDLLCKRIAPLFGLEKVSSTVRKEVDYKLPYLKNHVIKKGDFLLPNKEVVIKPMQNNTRPIQHINTEELAVAMYHVAKICVGATVDSICSETARAYGFKRKSEKINSSMLEAYEQLKLSQKVKEIDGKVIVV
ncbi:MAG: DNA/RNA helicase [Firmicutes bacterium HGW-Firmicutes-7]|nr:MAG: DNA/RNA helicase [Firmicutes bacterium HGW-Firmicutes-7]